MEQVRAKIKKDLDTHKIFLTIELLSAKPNKSGELKSTRDIQMFGKTEKELDYEIRVTAGALAEHQNDTYKDNHDPEEVARQALEAVNRAMVNLDQAIQSGELVDSGVINP